MLQSSLAHGSKPCCPQTTVPSPSAAAHTRTPLRAAATAAVIPTPAPSSSLNIGRVNRPLYQRPDYEPVLESARVKKTYDMARQQFEEYLRVRVNQISVT